MRVAVWHNLPNGGGKRALEMHVRGLVERGHHVEVWCPPSADRRFLPTSVFAADHVVDLRSPAASTSHGRVGRLRHTMTDVADRLAAMDEHCRACAAEINAGDFDVLFANACMFFRTTSIGRHVTGPRVLYLQEPYRWLYEAMPELPWLAPLHEDGASLPRRLWGLVIDQARQRGYRLQARAEVTNAHAFDEILVNSRFSRESVLRSYGMDSRVCYLGIDTERFQSQGHEREAFLVGVGAFVPEKNIEFVLEAVALLEPSPQRLVWVGNTASGPHLASLRERADDLGIRFEPRELVPDRDLVDLLSRADLMVYAPRLEPFGLAPLEANACGVPVVAVAEGGVRETIEDGVNGLLVDHDPRLMAAAVQQLRDDPDRLSHMRVSSRVVAERWSEAAAIDRLEGHLVRAVEQA